MGVGFLLLLALTLAFAAWQLHDAALAWRAFVLVLAGFAATQAVALWRSENSGIGLRADGIYCLSTRQRLVALSEIEKVEAGLSLLKPASGFVVRLRSPAPFARMPGLWWRIGRRLGIGGITPKARGKAMASALEELLRQSR